jgi:hypothetical protein
LLLLLLIVAPPLALVFINCAKSTKPQDLTL